MDRAAGPAAAGEMEEVRDSLEQEEHTSAREILAPGLRIALVVGVGLAILRQLVGINTIITFLSLIGAVGRPVTFWIYAVFAVVAFVFTWLLVPETAGKSLEQIETYWEHGRRWPTP
jgi:predicted MFS family arabinose efflux permease